MFEIYISENKTYTNLELKTDLEGIVQAELTEKILVDYIECRIRNTIDIGMGETKCIPYKEIRVRKKYNYFNNYSQTAIDSVKIERIQNLINDVISKTSKKLATLDKKYKNFRVEDVYLYVPLDSGDPSFVDLTIYITFVFNPLIYTSISYNANSNEKKIEQFNKQAENLKIDIEEDSTADDVEISLFNHPFAIAYDVLLAAFPEGKFIAIPKIKKGNYKIVKLDNYEECKVFDILGMHQLQNYTGPVGKNILKDTNQSIAVPHNYLLIDDIVNDFKVIFATDSDFNKLLNRVKPPVFKAANTVSITPTGNFVRIKEKNKEDSYKNNEVNILTRVPFGLSKLFMDMTMNVLDYKVRYTPVFQKGEVSKDYNTLLDIAADTYYINAYNRHLLFPLYTKWTPDYVFIGEALQKKIDPSLKYDPKNNRKGAKVNLLIDTKDLLKIIMDTLSKLFKF